jgi:hypothetical protein
MATVSIPWQTGGGNIKVNLTGVGAGSPTVKSDTPNEGLDREQAISWQTTFGTPQKTVQQTVRQSGKREVFNASDGEFILSGGGTFNVIKQVL